MKTIVGRSIKEAFYEDSKNERGVQNSNWFDGWFQLATHEPFEAVDFLMSEIVEKGRCVGCAACVEVCPVNVFDYVDEKPVDARHSGCVFCGLCAAVCPSAHLGSSYLSQHVTGGTGTLNEGFGEYRTATLARSKANSITGRAQDGGIATAILFQAMDDGLIDGVVLGGTSEGKPLEPLAKLATTKDEILSCAASRYTYSPNTLAIKEAYRRNLRVAIVGVPCQINGLRHSQFGPAESFHFTEWFRKKVVFTVGLFCSEVFTREGLADLSRRINVPLSDFSNVNVKGKIVVRTTNGKEIISSLKDMRKFMRPACNFCWDYSAELADISLGGIGLKGWTFTVARTEIGETLLIKLVKNSLIEIKPLEEEPKSKDLLIKLSAEKRKRPKQYEP